MLIEVAWSIKNLLCGIKSTEKMIFALVYFRAPKRKPVICKTDYTFRVSRFLVPSRQGNHRSYSSISEEGKRAAAKFYYSYDSLSRVTYV